ncbi:MAG: peptide methionine sulfoxide reductase [Ramlibacter sp.]|nr:peptide methionine sulfoxide reductase [Ramlibacter sp.]
MTPAHTTARKFTQTTLLAGAMLLAGWAWLGSSQAAESAVSLPPPAVDEPAQAGRETAVFAGGCFWGVQAVFQHTQGVLGAVSGYAGGDQASANYERVSSGRTGHAEAVQVSFDPRKISYGKLLQIYFSVAHDPTQVNRQGPDPGPQYRSAVFYQSAQQQHVAQQYIAQLDAAHVFGKQIATQVVALPAFYPAEPHHQDYATRNPNAAYIATFDLPKIANLKRLFSPIYRETPVLVGAASGS